MASRSIRPPLKHTPFTELLPDGTQFVTNSWYDWALNLQKAIDTLRVIVGDPDGDGIVDEGGVDDVNRLLAQEVTVFARDMLPTATGGCSALTVLEFGTTQPNVHALLFDPTTDESADFHVTLPFSWAGKAFKAYVYFTQETSATSYGVVWELAANCTGDDENIALDFDTGAIITESRVTRAGKLYITALSDAIPISSQLNRDGDLCSLRIYRRPSNTSDNLDVDAALIAVRFALTDTLLDPPVTSTPDPDYENVVLYLPCNGSDGSTTIPDLSKFARTGTGNANLKLSTTRSKFGTASLKASQRDTGGVVFGPSADFAIGTDVPYTMECWVYIVTTVNFTSTPDLIYWNRNATFRDRLIIYGLPQKVTGDTEAFGDQMTPVSVSANQWVHLAYTFDGTTANVWVDGTSVGSWARSGSGQPTGTFTIGGNSGGGTDAIEVYMDEIIVMTGVARYTGPFTPPTEPLVVGTDPESGPSVSARWYESNSYTLISDRTVGSIGLNCIANYTSTVDEVGIAHVSSADGTNAQVTRTGKVYLEFRTGANYGNFIGVLANSGFTAGFPTTRNPFGTTGYYCIHNIDYRGKSIGLITNGTASADSSYDWDPADVIGMAIDWDTGKVWFNKNTVWFSGDPAAGTSPTFTLPSGAFTIVGGAYVLSGAIQVLDLRARSGTTLLLPPTGFSWYA